MAEKKKTVKKTRTIIPEIIFDPVRFTDTMARIIYEESPDQLINKTIIEMLHWPYKKYGEWVMDWNKRAKRDKITLMEYVLAERIRLLKVSEIRKIMEEGKK